MIQSPVGDKASSNVNAVVLVVSEHRQAIIWITVFVRLYRAK